MIHRIIPRKKGIGIDISPKKGGELLKFPGTPNEIIMGIEHGIETQRTNSEFYKPIKKTLERRKRMTDEIRSKSKKTKSIEKYIAFIDFLSYVDLKNAEKHIAEIEKSGEKITRDDIEILDFAVTEALKTGAFNPVSSAFRIRAYVHSGRSLNTIPKIFNHITRAKTNISDAMKRLGKRDYIKKIIDNPKLIADVEEYMRKCDEFGGLEYVEESADGMHMGFPLQGGEEPAVMTLQENKIDFEKLKKLIGFLKNNRASLVNEIAEAIK